MKLLIVIFLVGMMAEKSFASSCVTKSIWSAENEYVSCDITTDGKTVNQKISDEACASYCGLKKATQMNQNYKTMMSFGFNKAETKKEEKSVADQPANPPPAE